MGLIQNFPGSFQIASPFQSDFDRLSLSSVGADTSFNKPYCPSGLPHAQPFVLNNPIRRSWWLSVLV